MTYFYNNVKIISLILDTYNLEGPHFICIMIYLYMICKHMTLDIIII